MMRWARAFLLLLVVSGCGPNEPPLRETTRLLMGTLVSIKTWTLPEATEQTAVAAAFAEMERIEGEMSSHRPGTPVHRVNAAPRGRWQPVSGELAALLNRADAFRARSGGAFDPGLEPLTRLWGFSADPPATAPPPPDALAAWREQRRQGRSIQVREDATGAEVRLENGAVGLDLGAIAKGYAVDQAIEVLRRHGVENAIVNGGGNLRVIGKKGEKPWRIGVQHPRDPERPIVAAEIAGDRAVVTSGDYERYFIHQGRRYHHLLDPESGLPTDNGLVSVTIQAPTAETADALSTAVFVLGMEKGLALLQEMPDVAGLLITRTGEHHATAGFIGTWLGGAWPQEANPPAP